MTETLRFHLSIRNRFGLWGYRLRSILSRMRRAVLYGLGRLSPDEAQEVLLDCYRPAGWHPLLTLTVDDTLDEARTCFGDHPQLRRLIADACERVAYKWENHGDHLCFARAWALDLAQSFARDEDIALARREDAESENELGPAI